MYSRVSETQLEAPCLLDDFCTQIWVQGLRFRAESFFNVRDQIQSQLEQDHMAYVCDNQKKSMPKYD
jgi:hypothetical protein